ncbi:MAG TPA: hypothetical protein VER39_14180 [Nocardioidaceae bacterium]|nr:hypothetical protein [Nocardioidaceae bacterium]
MTSLFRRTGLDVPEPVRARPAGDVVPGRPVRGCPRLRPAGRSASPRPADLV